MPLLYLETHFYTLKYHWTRHFYIFQTNKLHKFNLLQIHSFIVAQTKSGCVWEKRDELQAIRITQHDCDINFFPTKARQTIWGHECRYDNAMKAYWIDLIYTSFTLFSFDWCYGEEWRIVRWKGTSSFGHSSIAWVICTRFPGNIKKVYPSIKSSSSSLCSLNTKEKRRIFVCLHFLKFVREIQFWREIKIKVNILIAFNVWKSQVFII